MVCYQQNTYLWYLWHCCVCVLIQLYTTVLPRIVIPPEPRVIAAVRGGQPNTTFICEATGVPTPRISWIHNGRNISQSIDDRFQADITVSTGRTVRSMLNATQLRGTDSGRIDCVAYCIVSEEQPLSFSNTTLSVLSKCQQYGKLFSAWVWFHLSEP